MSDTFASYVHKRNRDRAANPDYYEPIECEKCKTRNDLQFNDYAETYLCDSCVDEINDKLREAEQEHDEIEEVMGDERRQMDKDERAGA